MTPLPSGGGRVVEHEVNIVVKRVEGLTYAYTRMVVEGRTPILERVRELKATLGDAIAGPPLAAASFDGRTGRPRAGDLLPCPEELYG